MRGSLRTKAAKWAMTCLVAVAGANTAQGRQTGGPAGGQAGGQASNAGNPRADARTGDGTVTGSKQQAAPTGSEIAAWQAALDRAGFSPGLIDGGSGPKTRSGLRAFQAHAKLPVTGEFDAATLKTLGVETAPSLVDYVITASDQAAVGPVLDDWNAKSKAKQLGYRSLAHLVAERGHCTQRLLGRLNPRLNLSKLKVGDRLKIPNVDPSPRAMKAASLEVDLSAKEIRVLDDAGAVAALFHCSIAEKKQKRPAGRCTVKEIVENPIYLFDPRMWPEVKNVRKKLTIPAGPRNPVGLCWIGLSLDGYGMHGTPEPENIGKTGSHGCFRLTNWDAQRLGKMLRVGAEVRFSEATRAVAKK